MRSRTAGAGIVLAFSLSLAAAPAFANTEQPVIVIDRDADSSLGAYLRAQLELFDALRSDGLAAPAGAGRAPVRRRRGRAGGPAPEAPGRGGERRAAGARRRRRAVDRRRFRQLLLQPMRPDALARGGSRRPGPAGAGQRRRAAVRRRAGAREGRPARTRRGALAHGLGDARRRPFRRRGSGVARSARRPPRRRFRRLARGRLGRGTCLARRPATRRFGFRSGHRCPGKRLRAGRQRRAGLAAPGLVRRRRRLAGRQGQQLRLARNRPEDARRRRRHAGRCGRTAAPARLAEGARGQPAGQSCGIPRRAFRPGGRTGAARRARSPRPSAGSSASASR